MIGWWLSIFVWLYCSNDYIEVRFWERWYFFFGIVGNNVFLGKDDIFFELNLVILYVYCKYSIIFFFFVGYFFFGILWYCLRYKRNKKECDINY